MLIHYLPDFNLIIYPILAYLIGSIPFGLIISEIFGKGNLRNSGSGNIGATNVLRTQGKLLGFITFLLDFAKGLCAYYFFQTDHILINSITIAAPVIGHMFPIWLKFKGGKGIATYFGVLCAVNIYAFIISIFVWITVFYITKISSISGLTSVISSCIAFYVITSHGKYNPNLHNQIIILITLVTIITLRHYQNIKRLINKTELKI